MRVSVCNHVTGFQNYPRRLKIAGLCVPWHLLCRWTSLPGPMATDMVSWCFMVSCKKSHLSHSFLKQAPFAFRILLVHFGTRGIAWAWGISDPGISGFQVQRIYSQGLWWIQRNQNDTSSCLWPVWGKRLVPSPCLPRCLVSSCFPRAVARRLRFKWAQVKLELERWTKKQDSLEWSENHERCFPTANTISEEAYANRTGMFPSRLSNDSNNSTFRGHSSTHTFPWLQPHDLVFSWKAPRTKTDTEMPSQILRGYETPLWNAARDGPPSPWNGFRSYTSTIGSCLVWRIGSMRSLG